ncbi:MAG: 30S ribosome-binding factor RbfA [Nitrospinae bacterium]|nr:30S ribosome-binding factor RbfA [Nitrospinota bacterium]
MRFKRSERIQELLQEEISKLIQSGLKDPRIGFATVTHVDVSENLKYAKVYISVIGSEKEKEDTIRGMESAKGYIRGCLGKNLYLRSIPELTFKRDDTAEYANKIQKLLTEIHHGRSS